MQWAHHERFMQGEFLRPPVFHLVQAMESLLYVFSVLGWSHGDIHQTVSVNSFEEFLSENLKSRSVTDWHATGYGPYG